MGIGKFANTAVVKASKVSALIALSLALGSSAYADTKRYLVKFKSPATFQAVSEKVNSAKVLATRNQAPLAAMSLFGTGAAVTETLDQVKLMVIESENEQAIASLKNHPAIALVEEEFMHPAPERVSTFAVAPAGSHVERKHNAIETPWGINAVKAPEAWATTKGENSRVVVLDTGVDVGHQALASRLEGVKNFTGGSADDVSDTVGHGTHVAGTVLADGQNGGLVGVAPEAKLLMGKVCSDRGCSSIAIAQGINWGVQEKAQVISMSLGGSFITTAESQALDAAEAAGVTVVAASGNDGTGRVSFPAAYRNVIAVGAIDSTLKKADFSQWGPELDVVAPGVEVYSSLPRGTGRESLAEVDLGDGKGANNVSTGSMQGSPMGQINGLDAVLCGLGKAGQFPAEVAGKIALISRGEITFKEKVINAISAGAAGVVIYNNAPGLLQGALTEDGSEVAVPVVMIEQTVGEAAKAAINSGKTVLISVAVQQSDYGSLQGTSMATPHVAGVVALIRSANQNLTPAQVRDILAQTATPLSPNDQNQFGAGLVNAEKAVASALSNIPMSLSLAN